MKIKLHTPMHLSDRETITEFEADDIVQVRSAIGDDTQEGTNFWVRDVPEEQFCVESASVVRKLVEKNRSTKKSWLGAVLKFVIIAIVLTLVLGWLGSSIAGYTQNDFNEWIRNIWHH